MAASVQSLYDQIIDLANTRDTDGYFYSGHQTDTKPFANQTTVAGGAAQEADRLAGDQRQARSLAAPDGALAGWSCGAATVTSAQSARQGSAQVHARPIR